MSQDRWIKKDGSKILNAANVCFTLNNYTDEDIELFNNLKCKYIIYGKEVGENGTPHLQGYIELNKSIPKATILNICKRAHWEPRLQFSTGEKASAYCKKEGDFIERGELKKQGKREDLKVICDAIKEGELDCEGIRDFEPILFHQYGRTFEKVEDDRLRKVIRMVMTIGIWIWGETRTGKSEMAYEGFSYDTHYNYNNNDKGWWCNYRGQEVVIINDFRGKIEYDTMLNLVDKYPYEVPRRGRPPFPFTSKKVIITSALPPWEIYHNRDSKDSINQLLRRFDIWHYTSKGKELVSDRLIINKILDGGDKIIVKDDKISVIINDGRRINIGQYNSGGSDQGNTDARVYETQSSRLITLSPDKNIEKICNLVKDEDFEDYVVWNNEI